MEPQRTRSGIAAITLGLLGASLVVAGCGTKVARGHTEPAASAPIISNKTITINKQIGITFTPARPGTVPALTARQAWANFTSKIGHTERAIPSDITAKLGLLTLPLGPAGPGGSEVYTAHNKLVYAYIWRNCPTSRNPNAQTLPPNPCLQWTFLDADTGRQIETTYQQ